MTATRNIPLVPLRARLKRLQPLVGNTPLVEIRNLWQKPGVRLFAKLEWQQFGGSVKTRPAFEIIRRAVENGALTPGKHLLDATSGNTGIAYAAIGAALGIPVTLCLPENASRARIRILRSLGAELILTSKLEGTDGAQQQARALAAEHPNRFFYADQYANPNNWKAHQNGTAREIWDQTQGRITHFVAGLGTTGTFTGTTRGLKARNPEVRCIALQPNNPMHGLEGWKHLETAIVPKIFDHTLPDEVLEVDTLEAYDMVRRLAAEEGLLVSPSAAANLLGAMEVARRLDRGVVVTTFADNAEKYEEVMEEIFR